MFFDPNDLCLTFKLKMVSANPHINAFFMHVSYNVINNILFNGKLKNRLRNTADKVARHSKLYLITVGGGPRVVISTAAFHARVRSSVRGLGGLEETKNVSSPSTCESQYCGEPP